MSRVQENLHVLNRRRYYVRDIRNKGYNQVHDGCHVTRPINATQNNRIQCRKEFGDRCVNIDCVRGTKLARTVTTIVDHDKFIPSWCLMNRRIGIDHETFNFFFRHIDADFRNTIIYEAIHKRDDRLKHVMPRKNKRFAFDYTKTCHIAKYTKSIFEVFNKSENFILNVVTWFHWMLNSNIDATKKVIGDIYTEYESGKLTRFSIVEGYIHDTITLFERHVMYTMNAILLNIDIYGLGNADTAVDLIRAWNSYMTSIRSFLAR